MYIYLQVVNFVVIFVFEIQEPEEKKNSKFHYYSRLIHVQSNRNITHVL